MGFLTVTENVWTRIFIKTSKCLSSEKKKFLKIFYYVYSGTRGRYEGKFGTFYFQEKAWKKLYKCGVNWQASQLLQIVRLGMMNNQKKFVIYPREDAGFSTAEHFQDGRT